MLTKGGNSKMNQHIFLAPDSPNTFYFYGVITAKFEPQTRGKRNGGNFTSYGFYLSVLGAAQFLEEYSNGYVAPQNSRNLTFSFSVNENIGLLLEKGQSIVIRGGLGCYLNPDNNETRYWIQVKEVFFNHLKKETSQGAMDNVASSNPTLFNNKTKFPAMQNYITNEVDNDFVEVDNGFNAFIEENVLEPTPVVENAPSPNNYKSIPQAQTFNQVRQGMPIPKQEFVNKEKIRPQDNSKYKDFRINA